MSFFPNPDMDITALYNQMAAEQNAQMQQGCSAIVQQTMNNPHVQQAYNAYRMQGGPLSFPDFAYQWAATRGFAPDAVLDYQRNEQRNQHQEKIAHDNLRAAEGARGAAINQMNAHYAHNQQVAGQNLMGQATYATPWGAQSLPYTWEPGYYQGPQGERYYVDPQRNYFFIDPWGQFHPMPQQPANLPFH